MSTCGCGHAVTVHVAYTGGCGLCACVHYRPTGLIAVTTQSHTTETGATPMTRTIRTAAELNALPVGSVVLGADLPDVPRRPLGERISPRWDPDARWNVDGRHYYGATETVLAVLGGAATVLHDPSTPAPAPSAATARHERAVAYADDVAEGEAPVPDDYERHYCTDDGEDWPCGAARAARVPEAAVEAARTAARLHSTTEPPPHENREVCCGECGEAIAYPGCTAEETSERAWRHAYRAALTAALQHLTAAPTASREDPLREALNAYRAEVDRAKASSMSHALLMLAGATLANAVEAATTPKEDR